MMNWIDWVIIGVIVFSALISIVRGFVKEALSLVSWIAAFVVASQFYFYITDYLTYFKDKFIRELIAIVILFIITLLVCSIVSYVIGQLVQKTGLSGTDRVLGVCFGILRGILVISAVLFFVDTFTPLSGSEAWHQSQLIPHFSFIIKWFFHHLLESSSFLNDTVIFKR